MEYNLIRFLVFTALFAIFGNVQKDRESYIQLSLYVFPTVFSFIQPSMGNKMIKRQVRDGKRRLIDLNKEPSPESIEPEVSIGFNQDATENRKNLIGPNISQHNIRNSNSEVKEKRYKVSRTWQKIEIPVCISLPRI